MTRAEAKEVFQEHGCTFKEGARHTKVTAPNGRSTRLWRHKGDIPIGTLAQMEKQIGIKLR